MCISNCCIQQQPTLNSNNINNSTIQLLQPNVTNNTTLIPTRTLLSNIKQNSNIILEIIQVGLLECNCVIYGNKQTKLGCIVDPGG